MSMDNDKFLVSGVGLQKLKDCFKLIFNDRKAIGYCIREEEIGQGYDPVEFLINPKDSYVLKPAKHKIKRLIFYWSEIGSKPDFVKFPFKMNSDLCAEFVDSWLKETEFPKEPDIDGECERGWLTYTEDWGHVDDEWSAIVAISPYWAMYGK